MVVLFFPYTHNNDIKEETTFKSSSKMICVHFEARSLYNDGSYGIFFSNFSELSMSLGWLIKNPIVNGIMLKHIFAETFYGLLLKKRKGVRYIEINRTMTKYPYVVHGQKCSIYLFRW